MTQPTGADALLKFRLRFTPAANAPIASESLWGRWLARRALLVLAQNNGFHVPVAVNDVFRVQRDADGTWRAVEVVRVTESVTTVSQFGPPVTTRQAVAVHDGWVEAGHALHTEGGNNSVMSTAWQEHLILEDVLAILAPVFVKPGWTLWEAQRPDERYDEIRRAVCPGRLAS